MESRPTPEIVRGRNVVAGIGQFYGVTGQDRVTILDVDPQRPDVVWDGGVPRTEVERALADVRAAARSFRQGEFDTMHADAWQLCWTIDPGSFVLWDTGGPRLWVEDGLVHRRARSAVRIDDIACVKATLSDGWRTRGMSLELRSGPPISMVRRREPMTWLDPTYDFIDLSFDARWCSSLSQAFGRALDVSADCSAFD